MQALDQPKVSAASWRPDLIRKYDVAGPRYTSYPTALRFQDGYTGARYSEFLRTRTQPDSPLSLYVHLPFCNDICYYCACNKVVTRKPGVAARYLEHLDREIRMMGELIGQQRPINQLHLGGGTPTYLNDAEMTQLVHSLATHFHFTNDGDREYSIEIDPRTVGHHTIPLLKGLGFNRVSLGVQDFDERVQRAVNRIQSFESIRDLTALVRQHDFRSLSYDLIYGLPFQNRDSMATTLQRVIELAPDRISCYNYAHLPHAFPSQRAISRLALPSAEDKLDMLGQIVATLTDAGYRYIGMDHFVLPEDELSLAADAGTLQRNFQGYSTRLADELIGLGVSAISSNPDLYVQNARSLDEYYALLDDNELPVRKFLEVNVEDKLRRAVIMSLICRMHLNKDEIEAGFGIDFDEHFASELERLEVMRDDDLLVLGPREIQVTELGRPLIRNICMVFDEYLDPEQQKYSRTI
jgi:oxygen-independent coproporphyrinogen-3 oxidase